MKKSLIALLIIFIVACSLLITAYSIIVIMPSSNTQEVDFVIKQGDSIDNIATRLYTEKLIKSKLVFKTYLFVNSKKNSIQPDEYKFKTTNLKKIVDMITILPEKRKEIRLVFLEGWTAADIDAYLVEKGLIFSGDFTKLVANTDSRKIIPDTNYNFFADKPLTADMEGYLFPDTYNVFEDEALENIVKKMLDNFDYRISDEMRQAIAARNMKIFDVITLASIVEKEARTKTDKEMVAGIFLNRLSIGQRLESDATINYITGKQTTRPNSTDLDQESLYNTYKYSGLPPSPICNPGLDSINAVIYPKESDYMFFLNTPGNDLIFSKTYDEHLANKYKYYPN